MITSVAVALFFTIDIVKAGFDAVLTRTESTLGPS